MTKQEFFELCSSSYFTQPDYPFDEDFETAVLRHTDNRKWYAIVMKDMSVLQESPFTDRGSIVEIFTDMSIWLGIRNVIDRINANAAA